MISSLSFGISCNKILAFLLRKNVDELIFCFSYLDLHHHISLRVKIQSCWDCTLCKIMYDIVIFTCRGFFFMFCIIKVQRWFHFHLNCILDLKWWKKLLEESVGDISKVRYREKICGISIIIFHRISLQIMNSIC